MSQLTINQRIKFLLDYYKLSVRAFSELIGHKAANTQNYVGARGSMPGADYLQSIIEHFEGLNPAWLLTGRGEPFLSDTQNSTQTGSFNVTGYGNKQSIKGSVQANSGGRNTQNNVTLDDCKQALQDAQREVEFLQGQVKLQEAVIAAKEETITLLRASFNRPN